MSISRCTARTPTSLRGVASVLFYARWFSAFVLFFPFLRLLFVRLTLTSFNHTGGPTYCALAALALAPIEYVDHDHATLTLTLTPAERRRTVRWLVQRQAGVVPETEPNALSSSLRSNANANTSASTRVGGSRDVLSARGEKVGEVLSGSSSDGDGDGAKGEGAESEEVQYEWAGGMSGRTEKAPDACYSFWCGAALQVGNLK